MVFTSADPVRAPLTGSPFDQTVPRRGIALAARNEIARPVAAVAEIATSPPEPDRSIDSLDLVADIRAAAAAKAMRGERPMGERPWMPPDGRIVHRHPAGAPSEAVPALAELQALSPVMGEDAYQSLTLEGSVQSRRHIGGTAPEQVRRAVNDARARLG